LQWQEEAVAKTDAWHSTKTRDVYHNSTLCNTGNNIEQEYRASGTGNLPRCKECARWDP
jgi:hypothetical protein